MWRRNDTVAYYVPPVSLAKLQYDGGIAGTRSHLHPTDIYRQLFSVLSRKLTLYYTLYSETTKLLLAYQFGTKPRHRMWGNIDIFSKQRFMTISFTYIKIDIP